MPPSPPKPVLVVGELNVDLILLGQGARPEPGKEVLVDDARVHPIAARHPPRHLAPYTRSHIAQGLIARGMHDCMVARIERRVHE